MVCSVTAAPSPQCALELRLVGNTLTCGTFCVEAVFFALSIGALTVLILCAQTAGGDTLQPEYCRTAAPKQHSVAGHTPPPQTFLRMGANDLLGFRR